MTVQRELIRVLEKESESACPALPVNLQTAEELRSVKSAMLVNLLSEAQQLAMIAMLTSSLHPLAKRKFLITLSLKLSLKALTNTTL
jgi:hypothetical protein